MMCENCKQQSATVKLHVQLNQQHQELHLCHDCYNKLNSDLKSATPGGPTAFGHSPFEDLFSGFMFGATEPSGNSFGGAPQTKTMTGGSGGGILDELGRNLSLDAKQQRIDGVIGREKEIERVTEILNRRNKNNPVLIGEPGVGKTAIAEGLALKIAEGQVPTKLMDKQIYALDVSALVADTGIRGQFEQRMKQLISELEQRKDVILFVDELHLLVGAGAAQGGMDAGNILKPALARGDIQVIGATTLKEYRAIEKDAALERRFQPVMVSEPTIDEAIAILTGLQSRYEAYHQVKYSDAAIRACVGLSQRYIQDRFLPDKAIDLLDEAGSKANLGMGPSDADALKRRLAEVVRAKEAATVSESYERAAELRDEEMKLRSQLDAHQVGETVEVTEDLIQQIVESKTGIPVRKLQENEQHQLKDLEQRLATKVIGQSEGVAKVAKAIRRSRAGLKAPGRPIGSFLFVGPTGVGKTELAKQLATELFGTDNAMIRLDMSEYMEKHSVSKLIGSPPGYVGYDEAGQLTERVRRKPYSLILLDEIEKAHPDVQHAFLQIMEDGRLTDSQGRVVSFKDTIIIMTSNAGVLERKATVGFGMDEEQSRTNNHLSSLGNFFKPEFLNRFDSIIEFHALKEKELVQIAELLLTEVKTNLQHQGIDFNWTQALTHYLIEIGYDAAYGARPLRRVIQERVENDVADLLLDGNEIHSITVNVNENNVVLHHQ